MDQPISLIILRITMVMTRDYLKCCNASLLIYRGFVTFVTSIYLDNKTSYILTKNLVWSYYLLLSNDIQSIPIKH